MAHEMTTKAQEAVSSALQAAGAAGNPQVEPIHLLEALIEQREGIALSLLEAVGADVRAIGARTRNALVALPSAPATSTSRPSICSSRWPHRRPRQAASSPRLESMLMR